MMINFDILEIFIAITDSQVIINSCAKTTSQISSILCNANQ